MMEKKKELYDCSFNFDDSAEVKKYKYLVVFGGDLDLNGCMMLRTEKDLTVYLRENKKYSGREILASFRIREFKQSQKKK